MAVLTATLWVTPPHITAQDLNLYNAPAADAQMKNPYQGKPAAVAAGKTLYAQNCATCHAGGGNVIDPSSPLLNSSYARSAASLLAFIRSPKHGNGSVGAMPAFFFAQISDRQSIELYNYIANVLGH